MLRETAISTYTGKEKRSQINDLRKKGNNKDKSVLLSVRLRTEEWQREKSMKLKPCSMKRSTKLIRLQSAWSRKKKVDISYRW